MRAEVTGVGEEFTYAIERVRDEEGGGRRNQGQGDPTLWLGGFPPIDIVYTCFAHGDEGYSACVVCGEPVRELDVTLMFREQEELVLHGGECLDSFAKAARRAREGYAAWQKLLREEGSSEH